MSDGFNNVGQGWTREGFKAYLAGLKRPTWCDSITLHHTASPTLADRPKGLTVQHIKNIQWGYENERRFRAGPHLFIDDTAGKCVMGMTPLYRPGVHAVSFNATSIGIEVLGDYDSEDPKSGRGLAAWQNAAAAAKALLAWLGLPASGRTVHFHRDDPRTTKTCPGEPVAKDWVLELIAKA